MLISFYRVLKTALISLWRNSWLSLASTLIMIVTLIIITIFVSLYMVTNKVTQKIEDKIDMIAYIKEDIPDEQVLALRKMLLNRSDVVTVNYVSKAEALKRWQEKNRNKEKIRDAISPDENPLPRSLEIKSDDPNHLDTIASVLGTQDYAKYIEKLSYSENKDMINRLIRITNFIKISGSALSILFILISILVIYNTIRLTIFARSDEIEIMRLVGATEWYTRGPFVMEGIAYGLAATIIASIIIFFAFKIVMPIAYEYLGDFSLGDGYFGISFGYIILMQLLVGIILGFSCSALAIKKHLK